MSKHADKGKWAEGKVQEWLDARSAAFADFAFHRFPDARAARGALAAQPADYLVSKMAAGGPKGFLLEVKECANETRLPKAKIGQYGKLKMFELAGMWIRVLVYRSAVADWVFLTEHNLFYHDECPASFQMGTLESFPTASKALEEMFA